MQSADQRDDFIVPYMCIYKRALLEQILVNLCFASLQFHIPVWDMKSPSLLRSATCEFLEFPAKDVTPTLNLGFSHICE